MAAVGFTEEQKQQAHHVQSAINALLAENRGHEADLERNFVQLGTELATVRADRLWRAWEFTNFSAYMKSLDSRTKAYRSLGIARDLLPHISKEDLLLIGISKAGVLRSMVKGGKPITQELIALARDKTKQELEGAVDKELGLTDESDETAGPWFSFGGAHMQEPERTEFLHTVNVVIRAADLGGEEIASWQETPSLRKKQIMQVLCAEFRSTYEI